MLMTQTAEYALRAMACLANVGPDRPLRSKELAEAAHIPSHYVSKVMRRLVVASLVSSKRGHGGGFSLARRPDQITFLEVLEATDHFVETRRCAFGMGDCDSADPCPLHPAWVELNTCMGEWARKTTLAGVIDDPASIPPAIQSALD